MPEREARIYIDDKLKEAGWVIQDYSQLNPSASFLKTKEVIDTVLKQSNRLRQNILKLAFEGKIVHQDPNDEPAEKLLERIREFNHVVQKELKRGNK